jgi:DNA-binding NtrC family response regulator
MLVETLQYLSRMHDSDGQRTIPPAARDARLLLVEDDRAIAQCFALWIGERYHVSVADGAEEALRMIALAHAPHDVLLSDLQMPMMDGLALHRVLDARCHPVASRFVLMTGAVLTWPQREYVDQHAIPVLQKPFDIAGLEAAIGRLPLLELHPLARG